MAGEGTSVRRSHWLLATVVSLVLLAVSTLLTTQGRGIDGAEAFPPQPHRRFINVGSTDHSQFSDEEFRFLAENFDYVVLTKFHGGFDIALHHEVAHRLVELNPAVRVFPYFSTKYWFKQNNWGGRPFDPTWYLRDNEGNIIYRSWHNDGPNEVPYLDLANPEYRKWALDTLRSWLDAAPYTGIFFDSAEPIGDHGEEITQWAHLLGRNRIKEYNAGMRTLLADAKRMVGPNHEIIFNGIAPEPLRGPSRNLELLRITDGAVDERFCLDVHGEVHALQDNLELMNRYDDRRLFLRTNYPEQLGEDDRQRYGRFCLAHFLLGWRPGLTYFQFGDSYTADQLRHDITETNVPVGLPAGPYRRNGDVLSRSFEHGQVYVNAGYHPAQVILSRALTRVQAGQELTQLRMGDTLTVPPRDAVFLLELGS